MKKTVSVIVIFTVPTFLIVTLPADETVAIFLAVPHLDLPMVTP